MNTISFECAACSAPLRVGDHLAGKRVRCPKCKNTTIVPLPDATDMGRVLEEAAVFETSAPAAPSAEAKESESGSKPTLRASAQDVGPRPHVENDHEPIDGVFRTVTIAFLPGVVISFLLALALSILWVPELVNLVVDPTVDRWVRFALFRWIGVLLCFGAVVWSAILALAAARGVFGRGVIHGLFDKGDGAFETTRWTFLVGYVVYTVALIPLPGWLIYLHLRARRVRGADLDGIMLGVLCGLVVLFIAAFLGRRLYRRWFNPPEEPSRRIAGTRYGGR